MYTGNMSEECSNQNSAENASFAERFFQAEILGDFPSERKCSDSSETSNQGAMPLSCGYCDTICIYNVIEMAFVVGVVANSLVIARVIKDKRLRDPTFIGIAALAFADLLFLTLNLLLSFEIVVIALTCLTPKLLSRPWYIMNSMIWFSANSHVALLAILRYLTIAYPVECSVHLTARRVVMLSAGVWILGMLLLGTLAGMITAKLIKPGASRDFIIIWWLTVYLIPLIVTTILHILKMFRLKKKTKDSTSSVTRRSMSRMSKIVPLVIIMATVLPLPKLIFNCMRTAGYDTFPSETFKQHLQGISQLVYLVNHFINPFIYGFLSKKFRNSLKDMLSCICTKYKKRNASTSNISTSKERTLSNTTTMSRNLSSISSCESMEKIHKLQSVCSVENENNHAYNNNAFTSDVAGSVPNGTCSLPVIQENDTAYDNVFEGPPNDDADNVDHVTISCGHI